MSKLFITGPSGFIGTHLIASLHDTEHSIFNSDCESKFDVTDETNWESLSNIDCVIHLAGKSFVPDSWNKPGDFIRSNFQGVINALEYCRKNNGLLIFLSSYLYGDPKILPTPETCSLIATNPYAFSKYVSEDVCKFYAENLNTRVVILRLFNVYGPGQSNNFLIPTILKQMELSRTIVVKDLDPKRDYVYVKDVVNAIIKSIDFKDQFGVFNIGSGKSYSVKNLIDMIMEIKGISFNVESLNERRKGEIMDTMADIDQAKKKLKWSPVWEIKKGLQETIQYYQNK